MQTLLDVSIWPLESNDCVIEMVVKEKQCTLEGTSMSCKNPGPDSTKWSASRGVSVEKNCIEIETLPHT